MSVSDTFTCAACKGTFAKGRSDEEAVAERDAMYRNGPPPPDAEFDVVCETCFDIIMEGAEGPGWRARRGLH